MKGRTFQISTYSAPKAESHKPPVGLFISSLWQMRNDPIVKANQLYLH